MAKLKDRVQVYLDHDPEYAAELKAIDDMQSSAKTSHVMNIIITILVIAVIGVALSFGVQFILAHLAAVLVLLGLIVLTYIFPTAGIIGLIIYAIWLFS